MNPKNTSEAFSFLGHTWVLTFNECIDGYSGHSFFLRLTNASEDLCAALNIEVAFSVQDSNGDTLYEKEFPRHLLFDNDHFFDQGWAHYISKRTLASLAAKCVPQQTLVLHVELCGLCSPRLQSPPAGNHNPPGDEKGAITDENSPQPDTQRSHLALATTLTPFSGHEPLTEVTSHLPHEESDDPAASHAKDFVDDDGEINNKHDDDDDGDSNANDDNDGVSEKENVIDKKGVGALSASVAASATLSSSIPSPTPSAKLPLASLTTDQHPL